MLVIETLLLFLSVSPRSSATLPLTEPSVTLKVPFLSSAFNPALFSADTTSSRVDVFVNSTVVVLPCVSTATSCGVPLIFFQPSSSPNVVAPVASIPVVIIVVVFKPSEV